MKRNVQFVYLSIFGLACQGTERRGGGEREGKRRNFDQESVRIFTVGLEGF